MKSEENTVADALSRMPIEVNHSEFDHDDELICHIELEHMNSVATLRELQAESTEEVFNEFKRHIRDGGQISTPCLIKYKNVKDNLCVCDNIVMRGDRSVVPGKLQNSLLHAAHESHQGMTRTKPWLREL
jgi:hypothetical protein